MKKLFMPAISFLNRLKYTQKFAVIGLFIIIPVVITMYLLFSEMDKNVQFAQKERIGVEYLSPVKKLLKDLQQHRGMANAYINGDSTFKDKLAAKETDIAKDIDAINNKDTNYGDILKTKDSWNALRNKWQSLKDNLPSLNSKQSYVEHTNLIDDVISFMAHIGDTSNLILDPDLDSFYLMESVVNLLPNWAENLGQTRAMGAGITAKKSITLEEKTQLIFLTSQIKSSLKSSTRGINVAFEEQPALRNKLEANVKENIAATNKFLDILNNEILIPEEIKIAPNSFFTIATETIDTLYKTYDSEITALDTTLVKRINSINNEKYIVLSIVILGFMMTLYLIVAMYLAIMESISSIEADSLRLSEGDLTVSIDLKSKDEMQLIGKSFNKMSSAFSNMITANKKAAEKVALSSNSLFTSFEQTSLTNSEITEMIQKMAQGADLQLRSSEESTKAMGEMASGIQRIAETSSVVSESSSEAAKEAELGNQSITKSIDQMESISHSVNNLADIVKQLGERSKAIGHIIEIISGIASQTNLLALNAAIEAARAGEQGRGFAVVAEEVRKLAEQSSQSSQQIAELIQEIQHDTAFSTKAMEQVSHEVELGKVISNEAGENFKQIYSAAHKVAEEILEITAASQEMSACSEEVLASLESMTLVAQELAASSQGIAANSEVQLDTMEEISSAADSLNQIAKELLRLAGKFKIN